MTLDYFGRWKNVINIRELLKVMSILNKEYKHKLICPAKENVFKAFNICPYNELKIVMLGQDPYPQKDIAQGILFGNSKNVSEDNLSPSLKVIKDAVINFDIPHNCIIFDQTLESWAKQGILMINSAFTCEMNKVGSHVMLWRNFTSSLIENICKYNTGIVFVLFGKQAQTFSPYISKNNYIFNINHPAYYARTNTRMPSSLFNDINKIIEGLYGNKIIWYKEY